MKLSKKRISVLIGLWFLLAPFTTFAANKVVVIPLMGDNPPLKNIVTVARANGKFTDPVAAVNSITDASASNPYLVVIGSGGNTSYGVYNNSSSPVMTHVTATATEGGSSYGVLNYGNSNPKIRHSAMEGGTYGLYTNTGCTSTVSQSTIIGGVGGTGTKTCVACDNGSGTALNESCQ